MGRKSQRVIRISEWHEQTDQLIYPLEFGGGLYRDCIMVTPLQTPNPYALEALPQEILNRVLVAMPVPDLISWGCGSPPLQRILSTAFRTLFAARCEWPLEFAHGPPLQR